MFKMNNCFDFFSEMQQNIQKGAILFIIRHWKKFVVRRVEERRLEEEAAIAEKKANAKKKKIDK